LRFNSEKAAHGGDRKSTPQNEGLKKTAERLTEEYKVGRATIERSGTFAAAVDTIAANVGPEARQTILRRDSGMSAQNVVELARRPVAEQRAALHEPRRIADAKPALYAEPNRRFPDHSGVPHGCFQVVGLKEISQSVGAIAVEDHDHVVRIIDRLQNALLEGVLLPTLVGIVDRLPSREVLNPVLYDCRRHGCYLSVALPAGQAWSDLSIIRLILGTINFPWIKSPSCRR
jgi:hypothetical protein